MPDFAFVSVGGGRVNVPVSHAQRLRHGSGGFLGRGLEYAEAERGDFHVVVEFQCWCAHSVQATAYRRREGGCVIPCLALLGFHWSWPLIDIM